MKLTNAALTDEQKGQICGILSVGCDRETAANFVGCSAADIGRTMQLDPAFAMNVLRTEASVELSHMRNVQQSAKEGENWRASVWWLERRSPERFGPRSAGGLTVRQLTEFIGTINDILRDKIPDEELRQQIMAQYSAAIDALNEMVVFSKFDVAGISNDVLIEDASENDGLAITLDSTKP